MECEIRIESKTQNGTADSITHVKRTEVALNPDFEALGSFLPDDIREGARVSAFPANAPLGGPDVHGVWQNGKPVPVNKNKAAESDSEIQPRLKAGDVAPRFVVKTLGGKELRLEDYRGKVVLLHFWAMWCKPCVVDAPRIKKEYEAMGPYEDYFEMISVSLDESEALVRRHVEEHGLTWPHACVGMNSQIAADYGVESVPAWFFIGPDGKILPSGEDDVKPVLEALKAKNSTA